MRWPESALGELAGLESLIRDDVVAQFGDLLLVEPLPDRGIVTVHLLHEFKEFPLSHGVDDRLERIEERL